MPDCLLRYAVTVRRLLLLLIIPLTGHTFGQTGRQFIGLSAQRKTANPLFVSIPLNLDAVAPCSGTVLSVAAPVASLNGTTDTYTIPAGGLYTIRISAKGAKGGNVSGGAGAVMTGDFIVSSGQVLQAIAGAPGSNGINNYAGGGGGGSGVLLQGSNLLILAGGGGGGGSTPGTGAPVTNTGDAGGKGSLSGGGGGGGLTTGGDGGSGDPFGTGGTGGSGGFDTSGGAGGDDAGSGGGGFGGGGGGGGTDGGGGGGGYTGGNGGNGGGSYNIGTNQSNTAAGNNGGGEILIECLGTLTAFVPASVSVSQPTCSEPGTLSISLTSSFQSSTGSLEYAIVTGNSFTGPVDFSLVPAGTFSVNSGIGTAIGTYTVRMRLVYNPSVFYDYTYTLSGLPLISGINALSVTESGCPVVLTGQATGNSFVVTGPNGYVFSTVYRQTGTYPISATGITKSGTYRLTATHINSCASGTPVSQTITVGRSCP